MTGVEPSAGSAVAARTTCTFGRGFTLNELLVVMAILGILAALLLPALRGVKQQAEGIHCLGNLKQFSLAWNLYADDHALKPRIKPRTFLYALRENSSCPGPTPNPANAVDKIRA